MQKPNIKIVLLSVLLFLFTGVSYAQSSITPNSVPILNNWLPVIMLGVMAGVALTVIFYMIGALLGNSRVKAGAINEFEQSLGTAGLAVMIIIVLSLFCQAAQSSTNVLSPSSIKTICNQLNNANLDFVSSNPTTDAPTYTLCHGVISQAGGTDITSNLDYGLAATYIIAANLTNQTVRNLNAIFVFDQYIGFLQNFNPYVSICVPQVDCLAGTFDITYKISYSPFRGYNVFIGNPTFQFAVVIDTVFYSLLLQMLAIIVFLFTWPYILAAGLLLRTTFFTRRVGGLLIAIVLTGLIIYPLIFLFEYVSLSNTGVTPIGLSSPNVISGTSFPNMQLFQQDPTGKVTVYNSGSINFFVYPKADEVLSYTGCWPINGNLIAQELIMVGFYVLPGYSLFLAVMNFIGSFAPSIPSYLIDVPSFHCDPTAIVQSMFSLLNVMGIMSVTGVALPVLNILIAFSGIKSLSQLMGGDITLLGIGKLV